MLRHLAEAYNALLIHPNWQSAGKDFEFRNFCLKRPEAMQDELHWWRMRLDGADCLPGWPHTGAQRWPFAMACVEAILDEGKYFRKDSVGMNGTGKYGRKELKWNQR